MIFFIVQFDSMSVFSLGYIINFVIVEIVFDEE